MTIDDHVGANVQLREEAGMTSLEAGALLNGYACLVDVMMELPGKKMRAHITEPQVRGSWSGGQPPPCRIGGLHGIRAGRGTPHAALSPLTSLLVTLSSLPSGGLALQ